MGWVESGEAWGARAADWASLFEPYAQNANDVVLERTGVGPGTRLLDIACGSGYAAAVAAARGATVSGLDASAELVAIARARTPDGDFRVGDMFALPFAEDSFDVATSLDLAVRALAPAGSSAKSLSGADAPRPSKPH